MRSAWQLAFAICVIVFLAELRAADRSEFSGGHGHLALKTGDDEWRGLHRGDELPDSCQLQTSLWGPVRIDLPAGTLSLMSETGVKLDISTKSLVLQRGRLLLHCPDTDGDWTITAGSKTARCNPRSEVEISYEDSIEINVLEGSAKVSAVDPANFKVLTAPSAWTLDGSGTENHTVPSDPKWAAGVRKRTESQTEQGVGQLIAKDAQSDSPVRLDLAQYHVNVVLQPPVALVQIDQSFFNPYAEQSEGTFVFNLPEGASVSRFAMYVTHDELIEGELIERKRADEIYTSIVRRKRDPAILEQIGTNLFRMRVFPIFAKDTKRILLDFTVPLVAEHGRYRFNLPLMSDLEPIWDFKISGTIHPPFAVGSLTSQSHPALRFASNDQGATFVINEKDYRPPSHLSVEFSRDQRPEPAIRISTIPTHNDEAERPSSYGKDQYFVITLPETANELPHIASPPTDTLIVVDTSTSMGNLAQSRKIAKDLIARLRPMDRFQLGCADIAFRPLTTTWIEPDSKAVRDAVGILDREFPMGDTKLDTSLLQGLELFKSSAEGRRRMIVYIGDGANEESGGARKKLCWTDELFQINNPDRVVFSAVVLSHNSNQKNEERWDLLWLRNGVMQTEGQIFSIHDNVAAQREYFEWTLAGMPTSRSVETCRVDGIEAGDLFYDTNWSRGRELHVYGRRSKEAELNLRLKLVGRPEQTFQLDAANADSDKSIFTGRLWAQRKLESLLPTYLNGKKRDLDESPIVLLSQEWSLMSPYTAFLVLETEADYARWNISRQLRHRYWKPAGAVESVPLAKSTNPRQKPRTDPQQADPVSEGESREKVRENLDAAQQALLAGAASKARLHLNAVRSEAIVHDPKRLETLLAQTEKKLRREQVLADLGLRRSVIDRRLGNTLPPAIPLVLGFSFGGTNPEYLDRHPHSMRLLKPAPQFKTSKLPLKDFNLAIQSVIGIPVVVDRLSFENDGRTIDQPINVDQLSDVSIQTLLDFVSDANQLAFVPERHLVRVMPIHAAETELTKNVYPLIDLLRTDVLPMPQRLGNPYLHLKTMSSRRTAELLQRRVVSVDLDEMPLNEALEEFFQRLGDVQFTYSHHALQDDGVDKNKTLITLSIQNVPAETVLDEILHQRRLEYVIRDGIVEITTTTAAETKLETRVYSAAGILDPAEFQNPSSNNQPKRGNWNYWGMGGGFGGGMGGGMGGGGLMMGGGGMGMGGGGGGIGPDTGATATSNQSDAGLGEIRPPDDEPVADVESSETTEWPASFRTPHSLPMSVGATYSSVLQSVRGDHIKWENVDGEGGTMMFHPASFSFVVHQTPRVHAEIKELFKNLRRMPVINQQFKSPKPLTIPAEEAGVMEFRPLMQVLTNSIRGDHVRWEMLDGEGGTISPHERSGSLIVRQTERVHEEIEQLLVQLRRARCLAESIPSQASFEGIDDLTTPFGLASISNLPRSHARTGLAAQDHSSDLQSLGVLKASDEFDQQWRHRSAITGRTQEFTIRRNRSRLELKLFQRIMRSEGPLASVAYPGLAMVEIDEWGDAVRNIADSSLPWLPHRSNEELAKLFAVKVESEDQDSKTLRFSLPNHKGTFILATISKATGTAIKWHSVLDGDPQFELRFEPKTVVAVDPRDKELDRWELLAENPRTTIPGVGENWGDFATFDLTKTDSPMVKIRESIRLAKHETTIQLLKAELGKQPDQPLLNTLLALSIEGLATTDRSLKQLQHTALERLAASGTVDLVGLIGSGVFPSMSRPEKRDFIMMVPAAKRSEELWQQLIRLDCDMGLIGQALVDVNLAIAVTSDVTAKVRHGISRIEILLMSGDVLPAATSAKELATALTRNDQLLELGQLFNRFQNPEIADIFFDKYAAIPGLTRKQIAGISSLNALWREPGEARWRLLLAADSDQPEEKRTQVDTVVNEADRPEHAEILGKLASEQPRGLIRTDLLVRQAELTKDQTETTQIIIQLYRENQLPVQYFRNALNLLLRAGSDRELVEIAEQRLIRDGRRDVQFDGILAKAYSRLGRIDDQTRAKSSEFEIHGRRRIPSLDRPRVPSVGSGAF